MLHHIEPEIRNLHGEFSRERTPVLTFMETEGDPSLGCLGNWPGDGHIIAEGKRELHLLQRTFNRRSTNFAIPLCSMAVTEGEHGIRHRDWQVQRAAGDQLLTINVPPDGTRRKIGVIAGLRRRDAQAPEKRGGADHVAVLVHRYPAGKIMPPHHESERVIDPEAIQSCGLTTTDHGNTIIAKFQLLNGHIQHLPRLRPTNGNRPDQADTAIMLGVSTLGTLNDR